MLPWGLMPGVGTRPDTAGYHIHTLSQVIKGFVAKHDGCNLKKTKKKQLHPRDHCWRKFDVCCETEKEQTR